MVDYSVEDRILIITKAYNIISQYFGHWQTADMDLDEELKLLLPDIHNISREEFSKRMMAFTAKLNNGHSGFYDKSLREAKPMFPLQIDYIEDEWIVVKSFLEEISDGMRVERIDGKPVEEAYQNLKYLISASSDREKRVRFGFDRTLFPDEYDIELEGGKIIHVSKELNERIKYSKRELKVTQPDDKTLYVHIPTFQKPEFQEGAIDAINEFMVDDGKEQKIIVDVRKNSGGSTPMDLIKLLMNQKFQWWNESTQIRFGYLDLLRKLNKEQLDNIEKEDDPFLYGKRQGMADILNKLDRGSLLWASEVYEPDGNQFKGKVVIIADRYCGSAGEDFIAPFKNTGRAIIIGEPTWGSTGQPFYVEQNDLGFYASTKRAYLSNGFGIEGAGVPPDIYMPITKEQLRSGTDPQFDKALSLGDFISN